MDYRVFNVRGRTQVRLSASAQLSLKQCDLWTLSREFALRNEWNCKLADIAAQCSGIDNNNNNNNEL